MILKIMNTFFRSILLSFFLVAGLQLHAQSTLSKANKQYELHAYNLASKSYQSIIEKQPNNLEALVKLADCNWHLNRMDEAKAYYERALQIDRSDAKVFFSYGQTLKAIAQYEQAKFQFQEYAKTYQLEGNHFAQSCDFALAGQQASGDFEVVPEMINTTSSDFGPSFFMDQVVFSSSRIDMNRSGAQGVQADWTGSANNQLFIARPDDRSGLSQPGFLRSELKNIYNEGPVSYSADGKWVAITKNNFVEGTRQIPSSGIELSLHIAEVSQNGDWNNPLPFPHNGPGYSNGFGAFSPDGQALYFASNRPDGFGGFDIFVSYRVGNSWSAPENLGAAVNSVGDEITPFFDGANLYFASNWHTGFGGFDVFKAQRSRNAWGSVTNMGSGINSPRDDYGFIVNPQTNQGYLTSNRVGGKGLEDIYRVQKTMDNIVFTVMNASDRSPISGALIDLSSCGQGRYMTDNNGVFTFRATSGLNCNIEVAKDGYMNSTLSVTTLGPNQSRSFEVLMKKFGDDYFGGIVNVMSGEPVDGALVRAISQSDGSTLEAYSDPRGMYALSLNPGTSYVIRYSKPGYLDVNRTLRSGDGTDRNILSTISITPSTTVMGGQALLGATPPGEIPQAFSEPVVEETVVMEEGFSVQVAAIEMGKSVDLSAYRNKLASLGNIYIHEEGGFQKVRLGPFPSEGEAKKNLAGAKSKGYKSAFMVRQPATTVPALTPKDVPDSYSAPSQVNAPATFKVQLAAYGDMRNFEEYKVQDIGIVEKKSRGKLTVVLLSGYESANMAREALATARNRGFTGAYLVQETAGGELIKVE
jgi:tetratricopeptide (TPR) repeat protein/cell division septation protein DedD